VTLAIFFSILCSIVRYAKPPHLLQLPAKTHEQKAINPHMTGSVSDHACSELRPRVLLANFAS
jgi:hypothetical protein